MAVRCAFNVIIKTKLALVEKRYSRELCFEIRYATSPKIREGMTDQ